MTFLERIIASKRKEIQDAKDRIPYHELEKSKYFTEKPFSLSASLSDGQGKGIIAEYKRMSPSKGIINSVSSVGKVTTGYAKAGASGLSVLTDTRFFGGNIDDLIITRELNSIPILRKDFIIDEYQVIESKAAGADAVLLIAAAIDKESLRSLATLASSLGMEVVLEVHSPGELEAADKHVSVIGVNNRDLRTFKVNTDLSIIMAEKIPDQFLKISESGISSVAVVKCLRESGYNGFLIGEHFMRNSDPVKAFSLFVKEIP